MKIRKFLQKTLAVVLTFAMLAPIMGNLEVHVKEVQAEETSADDSLNVKCQVTQGVVKETTIEKYRDKYVMRFVSAVEDYQDYKEIGFKLIEEGETKEKKGVVKTVFKRIESTTGSTADGTKETYNYSPKVIDTTGEYFMTAKLPIEPEKAATKYTVWAYGIKKDGTKVNGAERCVSVSDGMEECETINMSFQNTSDVAVKLNDTLQANDLDATVIGVSKDGTTVHVRVDKPTEALKSATLFTFKKNGTKVGEEIFRNLNTKYTGTADTSWYDVYKDTTDEFVIATSADLYGFAEAVTSSNKFDNKKVYLVSDIEANKGIANKDTLTWDKAKDDKGQDIEPYPWTAIGSVSSNYVFNGVFDGQMHTISGIYMTTSERYQGLFSGTGLNSQLKNFYLKNSYFYSSKITNPSDGNKTGQFGSIVGNALGKFDTIFSDAIVLSENYYAGGLLGSTSTSNSVTMNNCWFAGELKNVNVGASYMGGLVGRVHTATTIKNCSNTGNINSPLAGTSGVGGFAGHLVTGTLNISNCVNTGTFTVKSGANNYGRFVGKPEGGTLSISYSYSSPQEGMALVYGKTDATAYPSCGQYEGTVMADAKVLTTNIQSLFSTQNTDGTYESYWSFTKDSYPVLTSFAKQLNISAQAVDASWYVDDDNVDTYTLKNSGDLYGFALLARSSDFTGKTIQLGADIEVNTGKSTAEGWNKNQSADGTDITNGTDFMWLPIGNTSKYFNGTFDGQMHTISGIYLDTTTSYQGLFGATNENANISNFYLKNSYFVSTGATSTQMLGSIVGNARGTFANIYSNAIVESRGCTYAAGMIGGTAGSSTVTMGNCWFDGSVSANVVQSYYGGFVGVARTKTTLTNCLNTADITHNGDVGTAGIGGFVGRVTENGNVDIYYSVNTGNVIRQYSRSQNYGLFIGKIDDGKTVNASYSHSVHHGKQLVGASSGGGTSPYSTCHRFNADVLAGLNALTTTYDNVKKLFTDDDAKGHWSITTNSFPVLTTFANEVDVATQAVDTSWYDGTNEYTLYDSGDLYGFALLSQSNTFEDSKIKLGADITINQDMENPDFEWLPIGKFNGTFDGKNKTISGVYATLGINTYTGLFTETLSNSTIKNLYLKDSHFESAKQGVGSIAGAAAGKFYNIYSNADVVSSSNWIGGFIGLGASAGVEMQRCWFAGTVTNNTTEAGYLGTAGFIGQQNAATNGTTTSLISCLNTGEVRVPNYAPTDDVEEQDVGGFVGYVPANVTFIIDNSLNAGLITKSDKVNYYGRLVGRKSGKGTVTISNSYATEESMTGEDKNNMIEEYYVLVSKAAILGDNAKSKMPLLDWNNDWECVTGKLPQIRFSESNLGVNVTNTVSDEDEALLTNVYQPLELAFGDMHAHAKALHKYPDAYDKEYEANSLNTWKTEMSGHGLDFVASLDHHQTDHIESKAWNTNTFLYGTEPGTYISGLKGGKTGEMHYNMLFAGDDAKKNLDSVLQSEEFSAKYNLNDSKYDYGNFTKTEFTSLINAVQGKGGFFVIPHPNLESALLSSDWEDYDFGVDKVGFEVVQGSLSEPATQLNYKYWKQLLASGRKYFACAGSDIHGSLNGAGDEVAQKAITSVYVSEKNSLAYLEQFKAGNFTAGSVGIQMCVGTTGDAKPTAMGGNCDFAGKRLVVKIGDFHQYVNKPDRKYHVDIVTDKGVIYSQPLTLTENGPQDAVIAFDTDEKYMFYRVEVVDENDVRRIAYGNPIWNTNVAAK